MPPAVSGMAPTARALPGARSMPAIVMSGLEAPPVGLNTMSPARAEDPSKAVVRQPTAPWRIGFLAQCLFWFNMASVRSPLNGARRSAKDETSGALPALYSDHIVAQARPFG